ncbi:IclR family transcriptional regulator [uncultured Thalassospira sp.]|jgi:DNA-binding IclR family transcriptional regulator|uniref:IclR family transcriptional regulator n=1 Tax=uncultured Thalassospira sp. TaxID=404382 RepID=UPI0030DAFCCC|tara:strand:+ start:2296 stop:3069 length:774 start_codon:yes stop_codon:yes gene_type:complete
MFLESISDKKHIIQSVDVALSVLLEVSREPGQTLSALARNLGETKQKTLRMLRTMERRKFIQRAEDGGYNLGNAILVLGTSASTQIDLVKLASPVLETLGQKMNETVQIRIRDNTEALCIAKFEPSRDLRVHAVVGRRRPLHAGSSKILLAFLSDNLIARILPQTLDRITGNTITSHAALMRELMNIRKQGFCISHGEVSDQLVSVSVPIFAVDGSVLAALNVAAPAFRTQKSDLDRFVSLLTEAAKGISRGLGWVG